MNSFFSKLNPKAHNVNLHISEVMITLLKKHTSITKPHFKKHVKLPYKCRNILLIISKTCHLVFPLCSICFPLKKTYFEISMLEIKKKFKNLNELIKKEKQLKLTI